MVFQSLKVRSQSFLAAQTAVTGVAVTFLPCPGCSSRCVLLLVQQPLRSKAGDDESSFDVQKWTDKVRAAVAGGGSRTSIARKPLALQFL